MIYKGILEETPLGNITLHADENSIIRLDFEKSDTRQCIDYIKKHFGEYKITPGFSPELANAMVQLTQYFDGARKTFDLNIKLMGTEFYLRCWKELAKIPYGQVITYKTLAQNVGSPKAFRAVGQANHFNPISIIIPCHRVIASDGSLGGYGGGLSNKEILLNIEKENS